MPRVLICLAVANLATLCATAVLGFRAGPETADRHVLLAVFSLIVSSLCQVIVFTYFTITGKLINQAIHLGALDPGPRDDARRMKGSVTRLLGIVVGSVVLVTASGASCWRGRLPGEWHLAAAFLLIAVHGVAYYREYNLVWENGQLADGVLTRYEEKKRSVRHTPNRR